MNWFSVFIKNTHSEIKKSYLNTYSSVGGNEVLSELTRLHLCSSLITELSSRL